VSLESVRLIWMFRTATGLLMFTGVLLFAFNMYMTAVTPEGEGAGAAIPAPSPAAR
jgi:cbb3-type cytochrome oxidase subunit 1